MGGDDRCIICQDSVFIPVELCCFSCFQKDSVHCNTLTRICLVCAHSFLQLDRSSTLRDFFKKCIFCDASCAIHNLRIANAYRKDFMLMSFDNRRNYKCPYCKRFRGTQIRIANHLQTMCPCFYMDCECGVSLQRRDFWFHYHSCPYHRMCSICMTYISIHDFDQHQIDVHEYYKCISCNEYVHIDKTEEHLASICPQRLVNCPVCDTRVNASIMNDHLNKHEADLIKESQELHARLLECTQLLYKISINRRRFPLFLL